MFDDYRLLPTWRSYRCSLAALKCKLRRLLEGSFCNSKALNADTQTSIVHHLEHVAHPLVFLTYQVTHGSISGFPI